MVKRCCMRRVPSWPSSARVPASSEATRGLLWPCSAGGASWNWLAARTSASSSISARRCARNSSSCGDSAAGGGPAGTPPPCGDGARADPPAHLHQLVQELVPRLGELQHCQGLRATSDPLGHWGGCREGSAPAPQHHWAPCPPPSSRSAPRALQAGGEGGTGGSGGVWGPSWPCSPSVPASNTAIWAPSPSPSPQSMPSSCCKTEGTQ